MSADYWTLGQLDASDLGSTITVRDGGATYAGELAKVEHSQDLRDRPATFIFLRSGEWKHMKTYPSDTPFEVSR